MRNRYILLADLPIIALAAYGAFTLRFDWYFAQHRPEFVPYLVAALLVKPVLFVVLGMYARVWRYASVRDLVAVLIAVSAASASMGVYVAVSMLTGHIREFSRSVVFIDWLLTLCLTGGLRMAVRLVSETRRRQLSDDGAGGIKRVLVAGAGDAGSIVVREMRRNPKLGMIPVAFLDDDRAKAGKRILGIPVLGPLSDLPSAVQEHQISDVVIAMPAAAGAVVRAVADTCRQAGVASRIVPGVFELLDGHVSVNRLRNVDITDLLRREVVLAHADTSDFIAGRVVLITGAGGSIGSELARQIASASPSHLVLLGRGENTIFEVEERLRSAFPAVHLSTVIADVRDEKRLAMIFDRIRPAIVFHAAAHKHVPLMEDNPEEAVTNNIIGTRNVVTQAARAGTERLVLISTDKAVSPTSIMGATKRVAEALVRQAAQKTGQAFVVVRFGNVLGSRGSVVNTFKAQIERGGPVTVTHPDMTRFFMTIPEAVHLVIHAGGKGDGGELFVLDMGEPIKIVDLARDLIKLSGLKEKDIPITFTGVRAGEKLHERLFDAAMQTQPTSHSEVLRVIGPDTCITDDLASLVEQMEDAARRGDRVSIDMLLGKAVPGFVPNRHSGPDNQREGASSSTLKVVPRRPAS